MVTEVKVYGCQYCDKTYANRSSAKTHETKCEIKLNKEKKKKDIRNDIETKKHAMRLQVNSVEEIEDVMNAQLFERFGDLGARVNIHLNGFYYSDNVSNSHSKPIGGVNNWGGHETDKDGNTLPSGYPGWSCTISFNYDALQELAKESGEWWASDFLTSLFAGINTGGGGGGRYECRIYLSDFPNIERNVKDFLDKLGDADTLVNNIYYAAATKISEDAELLSMNDEMKSIINIISKLEAKRDQMQYDIRSSAQTRYINNARKDMTEIRDELLGSVGSVISSTFSKQLSQTFHRDFSVFNILDNS